MQILGDRAVRRSKENNTKHVFYLRGWGDPVKMESLQLKRNSSRQFMLLLSFLILATSLVVFYPFIFQKKPFIFGDIGSDTFAIYYPFFLSLFDKIEASDFTFWTFQYGFGVNILSRQSDIGSVFTWLLFMLGKENIKYMLVYIHILKILLSGIACFAYLSFFKFDNKSKLIAAKFIHSGFKLAYEPNAQVFHSHCFSLRQEYERNKIIASVMTHYKERLVGANSDREGWRLAMTVSGQLLRHAKLISFLHFGVVLVARFLGNRAGRRGFRGNCII